MADDDANLELEEAPVVETEDAEPERGASVGDHIRAAFKKHSGEGPESPEKPPARREDRGAKDRDRSGKFTKEAKPDTAPRATGKEPEPKPMEPAAPPTADAAPKSWTKEAQAKWQALDPQIRAEISKRENDMAAGAAQLKQRYGGIHEQYQKLAPLFQKYGRTSDQGLEQIGLWFEAIERNPQVAIAELAKSYGVNLGQPGPAPTSPPGATPNTTPSQAQSSSDPRIEQLLRTVGQIQSAEQVRQQSATQEAMRAWAANKPHFEAVRATMAQIIAGAEKMQDSSILDESGVRIDLDKVYERAIWQIPDVRAALLKEQAEARKAERQAAAEKARRAGSSVRPGAPGSAGPANGATAPKKGATVRDSIRAAIEELRS